MNLPITPPHVTKFGNDQSFLSEEDAYELDKLAQKEDFVVKQQFLRTV